MDKIWIELEYPKAEKGKKLKPGEIHEIAERRVEKANKVTKKLGAEYDTFFWHPTKFRYCVTIDNAGCFLECADNGHWFNLDFFAK